MLRIDRILDDLLMREGEYVAHPADRGGPTKYGITAATLGEWRRLGRPADAADVRALTEEEAREIYREMYYRRPGFDSIGDDALLNLVIDSAVHSGPSTVIRWLQAAVGVAQDGVIGPMTRSLLARADDAPRVYRAVLAARMRYIGAIIRRNRPQAVFAEGWLSRLAGFLDRYPW